MRGGAFAAGLALLAAAAAAHARSELVAPAFVDFPDGSADLTDAARAQVIAALRSIDRYRGDTSAYLCALGPPEPAQLRAERVAVVKRMLRGYKVRRVHDEPDKCAAMPQGERPGVLITWWPQWR